MESRSIEPTKNGKPTGRTLRCGPASYPILSEESGACLIQAPERAIVRGYVDIYHGDRHEARCLIVLSVPDEGFLRLTYKLHTAVAVRPPLDFAAE